jgi:hypothetical protein
MPRAGSTYEQTGGGPPGDGLGDGVVQLPQHPVRWQVVGRDLAQRGAVAVHVDGGFHAVAHHIAHHEQRPAEVQPHGLEPVLAHEAAGSRGQVPGGDLEVGVREAEVGQQGSLQLEREACSYRRACSTAVAARADTAWTLRTSS